MTNKPKFNVGDVVKIQGFVCSEGFDQDPNDFVGVINDRLITVIPVDGADFKEYTYDVMLPVSWDNQRDRFMWNFLAKELVLLDLELQK
jgi:hypothetical protein